MDYEATLRSFSWDDAAAALDGLPGGRGLNIAHEAVDRHATGERAAHVALRFLHQGEAPHDVTYAALAALTNRFANVLGQLGVSRGDRVFSLCGRVPYRKKVSALRADLPNLRHVLLIDGTDETPGTESLGALMDAASDAYEIAPTSPDDMALLHFTSGTTGVPKGAVHVHGAVVAHHATSRFALDLHPDDVFWCTADPGWVTGTSYGIIAPLTHGLTTVVDSREFDAKRWYRTLEEQRVTVWYTAPTAIRMLMRGEEEPARTHDLSALRFVASVGEPLNPEAVEWGIRALGMPIHDNWWQTETGGIMIANLPGCEVRPGSMGRPLPGITAAIVEVDDQNEPVRRDGEVVELQPDREGMIALRRGWPSMFRGYLHDDERYAKCFVGDWYLSGDLARRDADGWYWFVGRADDVIKTAGHLVGPFEVESALMEHPAVAEVAVIGLPDPVAGNVIKAFVTLATGTEPTDALRLELIGFGRLHLGAAIAPRQIDFVEHLPRTRSGKIMRRLLRARELGLPEGDLSTLETP